jgi:hypothetical protein
VQNIQAKVLEQIYNALIESRMMTGVEIWGLEGGWEEIEKVHEMLYKRIFGVPSSAANGACVRELGRTNRKEKVNSIHPDIGIKNTDSNKTRDNWTKIAQYLMKYKQKQERAVKRVMKEMK